MLPESETTAWLSIAFLSLCPETVPQTILTHATKATGSFGPGLRAGRRDVIHNPPPDSVPATLGNSRLVLGS